MTREPATAAAAWARSYATTWCWSSFPTEIRPSSTACSARCRAAASTSVAAASMAAPAAVWVSVMAAQPKRPRRNRPSRRPRSGAGWGRTRRRGGRRWRRRGGGARGLGRRARVRRRAAGRRRGPAPAGARHRPVRARYLGRALRLLHRLRMRRVGLPGQVPVVVDQLEDRPADVVGAVDGEVHAVAGAHHVPLPELVGEALLVLAVVVGEQRVRVDVRDAFD